MTRSARVVTDLLEIGASQSPTGTALIFEGKGVTYRELIVAKERIAHGLRKQGFHPGDRLAVCIGNSPDWIAAVFGVWAIGGAVVDILPSLTGATRLNMLASMGSAALITGAEAAITGLCKRSGSASVNGYRGQDSSDLACINLTSGSTGMPKGVMLTYENLLRNAELYIRYFALSSNDRTCLVLPLSFGMNKIALLAHLLVGATIVLEAGFLAPNRVLAAMEAAEATGFCAVPTVIHTLLTRGDLGRYPLKSLRYFRIGAGGIAPAIMNRLQGRLPHSEVYLSYGLTEVGLVAVLTKAEYARRPDACGRVIDEVQVSIEDHADIGTATGEITVRCQHAARGYCGDEESTRSVFTVDGVRTGDLGRLDGDGYLSLTGRAKDIIKSGGEIIAATEIEQVFLTHTEVAECAVVAVSDRWLGEAIKAYVALKPGGAVGEAEFERFCARHLSPIKRPKQIIICDSLPRTATGKIDKASLQDRTS